MRENKLKGLFASILMSMLAIGLHAQDTMITQDGDVKTIYVVDIGNTAVFYKAENTDAAAIQSISKDQIFLIKRADGTKYDLGNASTLAAQSETSTQSSMPQLSNEVSEEAMAENKLRIEKINSLYPECTNDKKGKADAIFCAFAISENSQLVNDDVSLNIEWGHVDYFTSAKNPTYQFCYINSEHAIVATIKNKTDRTIYVDLGNSFFIRGDQATVYYTPSATSVSSMSGSGVGVNAGAVAGALGIGGSMGKLAGGINVGGGSSSTTTNVTYSQRVVAIPPMSSKSLDYQFLFDGYSCNGLVVSRISKWYPIFPEFTFKDDNGKKYDYQIGEAHFYSEKDAPLRFTVQVSYSYTEDCTSTKSMRVNTYAKQILGFKGGHIKFNDCWGFYANVYKSRVSGGQKPANGSFPRP